MKIAGIFLQRKLLSRVTYYEPADVVLKPFNIRDRGDGNTQFMEGMI